ncbi:ras-related protein Rab-7L1-like [Oscarella lobularis]|uniref:ras-related protein Rab-7L1-like n=1 Tax=Oscarella lobularis TaxID=121494 RepID=UPI00331413E5
MKNEVGRVSSTMLSSDESVESSFHLGGGVMSGQVKDYFFKLLVIGDVCVGKTSFVDRYVYNKEFDSTYKTTIGVDFAIKSLKWSETERIRLQLWDLSGQERFSSLTRVYYRDAIGCLLFFDLSRAETFRTLGKWKKDLDLKVHLPSGRVVPCLLIANKCDLEDRAVSEEEIDAFCSKHGLIGWIETSVKNDQNISESIRTLLTSVLEEVKKEEEPLEREKRQRNTYISLNKEIAKHYREQTSAGCCSLGGDKAEIL